MHRPAPRPMATPGSKHPLTSGKAASPLGPASRSWTGVTESARRPPALPFDDVVNQRQERVAVLLRARRGRGPGRRRLGRSDGRRRRLRLGQRRLGRRRYCIFGRSPGRQAGGGHGARKPRAAAQSGIGTARPPGASLPLGRGPEAVRVRTRARGGAKSRPLLGNGRLANCRW